MPITIRDPIHGSIRLDDWAIPLVDHGVYQRLRRIHQLGTAHLVYPGAHHRRFEHGLGAHHLAGLFATSLGLTVEEALTVRAAALLHDVGHGPFSHAFEEIVKEHGRRHEMMSVDLVRWGPLADLLRQGGIDPVHVADAILGKGPLGSIVAGALDADRMDYLLRDAHYTGVRSNVDPERLISTLQRDPEHGVVLDGSGVLAAEAILTTRFLMYPSVYLHHTVRAGEMTLLRAVRIHLRDGHAKLADLERATDDELVSQITQAGGKGADLVRRLHERQLLKRAVEILPDTPQAQAVQKLGRDPVARAAFEREAAEAAGVDPDLVVLDVPRAPKYRELELRVRQRDDSLRPLADVSRLVRVLQEARMDHWRAWVFGPKRDRERLGQAASALLERI